MQSVYTSRNQDFENQETDVRVLVLAGGESSEREVSLQSGTAVALALTFTGRYIVDLQDPRDVDVTALDASNWDMAFPMVHGAGGEDGTLQRHLDLIGLPFVGSSATASELTFDKILTNTFLADHGIEVPHSVTLVKSNEPSINREAILSHGLPVVVKPPRQGSSIGISIVNTPDQIDEALSLAFQYGDQCLVEAFIVGREVTVPIVNGKAYPAVEIQPATDWYDYASKYADDRTQYLVDIEGQFAKVSATAAAACELCQVSGIARVDFRIDATGKAWLLEINTIPGMTSHSLVPKSALSLGQSMSDLCDAAIRYSLTRLD